jgi:thymidylate synthase (FAD)
MGSDDSIIKAMLVSTQGADSLDATASEGRINFLMKNKHGTPFEANAMTFFIEAPIFVFREYHRHRIGFSYSEVSGRYRQLDPTFYIPKEDRNLVQVGKPGAYDFVPGTLEQWQDTERALRSGYEHAFKVYVRLLQNGVAKEVARMVLPVSIYSAMYATCNARSMMAFLSLRTKREESTFPSFPMREIEMVAEQMEDIFKRIFPLTWNAYDQNGRVAP